LNVPKGRRIGRPSVVDPHKLAQAAQFDRSLYDDPIEPPGSRWRVWLASRRAVVMETAADDVLSVEALSGTRP
jgi:hypothetical protein